MLAGNLVLNLIVADNAALLRINHQHTSGTQAIFFDNSCRINIYNTNLRCENDSIIICNIITRRSETITVKGSANSTAISKGHSCRSVPCLNQRIMIFEECLQIIIQMGIFAPRLRYHHHDSMRQTASAHQQKFQNIVEHAGIGTGFVNNRHNLLDIITPKTVAAHRLARTHPVDVAAQCIYFTVMHQITVGMSSLPAGKCIGTETGMDKSHCCFNRAVLHVRIKGLQLLCCQHAFIDNSTRGQT